jgi:hypothetical protein
MIEWVNPAVDSGILSAVLLVQSAGSSVCFLRSLFRMSAENVGEGRILGDVGGDIRWELPPTFVVAEVREPCPYRRFVRDVVFGCSEGELLSGTPGDQALTLIAAGDLPGCVQRFTLDVHWELEGCATLPEFGLLVASMRQKATPFLKMNDESRLIDVAPSVYPQVGDAVGFLGEEPGSFGAIVFRRDLGNHDYTVDCIMHLSNRGSLVPPRRFWAYYEQEVKGTRYTAVCQMASRIGSDR